MTISLLSVAHIILAVLLILVVLLQRSESSMGALGGANAVFTGKSVSSILVKATAIIATLFILTSLLLVRQSYHIQQDKSVVEILNVEESAKPIEEQEPAVQ